MPMPSTLAHQTSAPKKDTAARKHVSEASFRAVAAIGAAVCTSCLPESSNTPWTTATTSRAAIDLGSVPRVSALLRRPRAFWGYGFGYLHYLVPSHRPSPPIRHGTLAAASSTTTLGRGLPAREFRS